MKSSFFNFECAFILVLHQESVSFQMWQKSGIFLIFFLFNRSPFLFNNRCQFCSELLLFVSFISSFLSLSFAYHPLHPPLSISPSLTRLSSETVLSIDGAVALCSLLQPLAPPPHPPQMPVCDRWPESQQNLGSHRVAWSDADFRKIECSVFVFFCWS